MFYFFIFLAGFSLALIIFFVRPFPSSVLTERRRVFFKKKGQTFTGIAARKSKLKKENLNKVLELFNRENKLTNNDIETRLKVSDATAERYLDELEKQGHIKQIGKTGKSVYYIKK